jgi:hypothetical protein
MEYWQTSVTLTDELRKMAETWHDAHFPKCRASLKHNNMCNHYRCFLDGYRCGGWLLHGSHTQEILPRGGHNH